MKQILTHHILILFSCAIFSQNSLDQLLTTLNKETIPYISVEELHKLKSTPILLDAREIEEYEVSHLKGSIFVGYNKFKLKKLIKNLPDKNQEIVVYCSIGVRSEDIAEQLKKAGYTNVSNLYGGIFEWKNNNLPVYNLNETLTDSVHAYDQDWGKWLKKGKKVFNER